MDKRKLIQSLALIAVIILLITAISKVLQKNSVTLTDYVTQNGGTVSPPATDREIKSASSENNTDSEEISESAPTDTDSTSDTTESDAALPDGGIVVYADGFSYEPLPGVHDSLLSFQGDAVSHNCEESGCDTYSYVKIKYYNALGYVTEGDLVCDNCIATDLVEIFYELYRNSYVLEMVSTTEHFESGYAQMLSENVTFCYYDGADTTSSDDALDKHILQHASGLAVDINPLYNPIVLYNENGSEDVFPATAADFIDRSQNFKYKIDDTDLCYKLFTEHGFLWGGYHNDGKSYCHFEKTIEE